MSSKDPVARLAPGDGEPDAIQEGRGIAAPRNGSILTFKRMSPWVMLCADTVSKYASLNQYQDA